MQTWFQVFDCRHFCKSIDVFCFVSVFCCCCCCWYNEFCLNVLNDEYNKEVNLATKVISSSHQSHAVRQPRDVLNSHGCHSIEHLQYLYVPVANNLCSLFCWSRKQLCICIIVSEILILKKINCNMNVCRIKRTLFSLKMVCLFL